MTTTLIIPDTHVPFHDHRAWSLVIDTARTCQPTRIVILGDFVDALTVSHFPRSPGRISCLAQEVNEARKELDRLSEAAPKARVTYISGNHEVRLEKYIAEKAPELFGLVDMPSLLGIRERGWEWVPYRKHVTFGKVAYTHDLGYSGKNAVAQCLDSFGSNIVFGHTHRAGVVYDGTVLGEHRVAMSCGWLGDFSAIDYMHQAKTRSWQHGIGWCRQDKAGNAWLSFAPIVHGRICIEGQWIGKGVRK